MTEQTPQPNPPENEVKTTMAPPQEPGTVKPATPRKRGPNKPKPVKSDKMLVTPVHGHAIYAHTQDIRINPDTITEVTDDKWIRRQIELGTLKEV